jgi:hypothetical protein
MPCDYLVGVNDLLVRGVEASEDQLPEPLLSFR